MINKIKISKYKIFGFLVVCLLFIPYLQQGIVKGSDDTFHLIRISSLAKTLAGGGFPVKFHASLCRGYGYGVGFFYPNLFLYIPAILIILGVSQNIAYKIFAFLLMTAIFSSVYYSSMRIKRDEKIAFIAATLFLLCNRIVGGFYFDFTIGNLMGAVFMPLAIVGMYLLLEKNERPVMLIVGFSGLVFSHPISLLLTFLTCILIVLPYMKKILTHIELVFKLILSVGLVVGISASIWLPMLDQYKAHEMKVSRPWTQVEDNVLSFRELLFGEKGAGYTVVLCIVIAVICFFWMRKKMDACNGRFILLSVCIGIIYTLLSVTSPFWVIFHELVNVIQFPARLLLPATLLISLACAHGVGAIEKKKLMNGIFILLVVLSVCNAVERFGNDIQETIDLTGRTLELEIDGIGSGEEWLPIQTTREMFVDKNLSVDSKGREIYGKKQKNDTVYIFDVEADARYCDIPYVYYRGFVAESENGQRFDIDENPETGLARVFLEDLEEAVTITVTFEGTLYQKLSYVGTAFSLILTILYFVLYNEIEKWMRIRRVHVK